MILCYGTLFPMHDVIVCILSAIYNSDMLYVESGMLGLKPLGGIKMLCEVFYRNPVNRLCEAMQRGPLRRCEVVVEDWFECCTLSPV